MDVAKAEDVGKTELIPRPLPVGDRIVIQKPLSRRGRGPGLLILTSESYTPRTERKTLDPEPCQKWAEEGFVVVNITIPDHAPETGDTDLGDYLNSGRQALKSLPECTDSDKLGLIFYAGNLDRSVYTDTVLKLISREIFLVAILFTDGTKKLTAELTHASMPPLMVHSSKSLHGPLLRADDVAHVYDTNSTNFVLPSHDDYKSGAASLAHTRSLSFIKKHLGGPIFDLEAIWDEHTLFEFGERNVEKTMSTMVDQPYVNHIPTMTGGIGRGPLMDFYRNHFIFSNPKDTELELVSRTIGVDRVIDEFIFSFTHDRMIDWILPGVPPTHKHARVPFTSVVNVRGDRLYHEHIAWDQATVLRQLGLLPDYLPFPYPLPGGRLPAKGKRFEYRVPTAGVETAQKLVDESSVVSNGLFGFDIREVDDI
ncbi:9dfc0452-b5ea-4a33-ba6e-1b68379140e2 [Sclerotinia trifoliorum]|uniref:9dfc0452-b5ea-4a33-ba6e-1b68379140e2 n=1 Tax=Sclerotinia trifoliorum TaxID=28548 RepID=A0A8H2VSH8_9HELO|nr:9dfc0452-b5ea-4a33-ba6e-1b68379140e2 [Sclerotinia trifoliorum]